MAASPGNPIIARCYRQFWCWTTPVLGMRKVLRTAPLSPPTDGEQAAISLGRARKCSSGILRPNVRVQKDMRRELEGRKGVSEAESCESTNSRRPPCRFFSAFACYPKRSGGIASSRGVRLAGNLRCNSCKGSSSVRRSRASMMGFAVSTSGRLLSDFLDIAIACIRVISFPQPFGCRQVRRGACSVLTGIVSWNDPKMRRSLPPWR
jgi:hypothetical protein